MSMSEKYLYRFHDLYPRMTSTQRSCSLLIALRRYKNKNDTWPPSLDDVKDIAEAQTFIDPINSSSFIYKLTDDSFILYSKGKNNIDEGGRRDRLSYKRTRADDQLIWPRRSRKVKEENPDGEQ